MFTFLLTVGTGEDKNQFKASGTYYFLDYSSVSRTLKIISDCNRAELYVALNELNVGLHKTHIVSFKRKDNEWIIE